MVAARARFAGGTLLEQGAAASPSASMPGATRPRPAAAPLGQAHACACQAKARGLGSRFGPLFPHGQPGSYAWGMTWRACCLAHCHSSRRTKWTVLLILFRWSCPFQRCPRTAFVDARSPALPAARTRRSFQCFRPHTAHCRGAGISPHATLLRCIPQRAGRRKRTSLWHLTGRLSKLTGGFEQFLLV